MIAAACGGDDGNDLPPDGSDEVVCGDGTCTEGQENSSTCPDDCIGSPNCGDGACDDAAGETWQNCADCSACGNGTCDGLVNFVTEEIEDCSSCTEDCGCSSEQTCWDWETDLGFAPYQCPNITKDGVYQYCGHVCGSSNTLIIAIHGRWRPVVQPNSSRIDVLADPSDPTCDIPGHEAGDACVSVFMAVLAGTRLFVRDPTTPRFLEGQVLDGGSRIEGDEGAAEAGPLTHFAWVKDEE